MKRIYRSWKTNEIAELRKMYIDRVPPRQIAELLNRSINAVRQRLTICRFSKRDRPWTEEEIEIVKNCRILSQKKTFWELQNHWYRKNEKGRTFCATRKKICEMRALPGA